MKRSAILIIALCSMALSGCHCGCISKRASELNCPTDIRQTHCWCFGEDALFHCPCGPEAVYYGYEPTCWRDWPTTSQQWRDAYCPPTELGAAYPEEMSFPPYESDVTTPSGPEPESPFKDDATGSNNPEPRESPVIMRNDGQRPTPLRPDTHHRPVRSPQPTSELPLRAARVERKREPPLRRQPHPSSGVQIGYSAPAPPTAPVREDRASEIRTPQLQIGEPFPTEEGGRIPVQSSRPEQLVEQAPRISPPMPTPDIRPWDTCEDLPQPVGRNTRRPAFQVRQPAIMDGSPIEWSGIR